MSSRARVCAVEIHLEPVCTVEIRLESVCTVEIGLEPESAQQRFVWSQSLLSRDSFGARVCSVEIRLEPESAH